MSQGGRAILLAVLASSAALAGCLGATNEPAAPADATDAWVPPDVTWDTSGPYSKPLRKGDLRPLSVEVHEITAHDGTRLAAAIWRPNTPEKVPVILDVGPYYGDTIAELGEGHEKRFMVDGFVKNGFAYGRVAVRGTSSSGGCMEFFGENEQKDMDTVVTYFGTRPWSNGNVALYGGSYDGTTPWMAAMWGNPHLKTIIPLSGLTSIYDHAFPNGTSWGMGPTFHAYYWTFGWTTLSRTPQDKVANALCPESVRGALLGPYTGLTGERDAPPPFDDYWEARDFRQRIKDNYRGSVLLVHGMQDWRVPPHMAFPFVNELQANGTEVQMVLGQWWHDYPDRKGRGDHVRWDYAEIMYRWLDKHLRGNATLHTGPAVVIEDSRGDWRDEATWPPADAAWTTLHLGEGVLSHDLTDAGEKRLLDPAHAQGLLGETTGARTPVSEYRATLGKVEEDLRFAGMPRLHATFVPTSPEGARIYAELLDVGEGKETVLAHAVMDLRYHEGGYERHALAPNKPIVARMQFFPVDAVVPAGHELVLRVVNGNGYSHPRSFSAPTPGIGMIDNLLEHPTPLPVSIRWGDGASVLEMPLIRRDVGEGKYPGEP